MTTANLRIHTDAAVTILTAAGLAVGDGTGQGLTEPYVVVHRITDGVTDGPMHNPDDDELMVWQINCVGISRQQSDETASRARTALLDRDAWVTALADDNRVPLGLPRFAAGSGPRPDHSVHPPVFTARPEISITTTPA